MTNCEFTSLEIQFAQKDTASVYYAHLQNVFKELYLNHLEKQYSKQEVLIKTIDKVLYDVYFQHLKLQKDYFDATTNLKHMLEQCTTLINECKNDREQLVKVTEDRQAILDKLKDSTNQSLEIIKENQMLHYQLDKMKEINSLFKEKNDVLEEQIINASTNSKGYDNIVAISKEFERISTNNVEIQKDIADILKSTEMYASASEPLQIMCLAFQEQPSLRQQFWDRVSLKHKNKFQDIEKTKTNFFNFSYLDALMLYSK